MPPYPKKLSKPNWNMETNYHSNMYSRTSKKKLGSKSSFATRIFLFLFLLLVLLLSATFCFFLLPTSPPQHQPFFLPSLSGLAAFGQQELKGVRPRRWAKPTRSSEEGPDRHVEPVGGWGLLLCETSSCATMLQSVHALCKRNEEDVASATCVWENVPP